MLRALLGLLYDVHGNLPALEAVLDDARGVGVERWIVGGDVVLFGAGRRRRSRGCASWTTPTGCAATPTAGSSTTPTARRPRPPRPRTAADALDEADVRELAGLPVRGRRATGAHVHASLVSDMRSFLPEPADDEDELLERPGGRGACVFGHTHLPFARTGRRRRARQPGQRRHAARRRPARGLGGRPRRRARRAPPRRLRPRALGGRPGRAFRREGVDRGAGGARAGRADGSPSLAEATARAPLRTGRRSSWSTRRATCARG